MFKAKRFATLCLLLVIAIVAAACSEAATPTEVPPTDPGETAQQVVETPEDDMNDSDESDTMDDTTDETPEFVMNVTGAEEQTIEEDGNFFCVNAGTEGAVNHFEMAGGPVTSGLLDLSLPADITPGTYELVGSGDVMNMTGEAYTISFRGSEDTYRNGSGEIVIQTVPQAEGEMFEATLTAELSNGEEATIMLDATLNVEAGMQSFDEC